MPARVRTQDGRLSEFVEAVRSEYWRRTAYDEYEGGLRQANTSRIVACQVLEQRTPTQQMAIVADLYGREGIDLISDPADIFSTAVTTGEVIFDLICEVCWQALAEDLSIRVDDEIRSALAEA